MKVPKKLAIFGFNLCASIFLGFCVYGLLIYIRITSYNVCYTKLLRFRSLGG